MKTSDAGIYALALHEGIVPAPYRDSVGVWTYGIGHTAAAGPPVPANMPKGMPADLDAALRHVFEVFRADLPKYEEGVRRAVKVPVTQAQFDALVSFHYNTGAIGRASLVKKLNAGDVKGAAAGFMAWVKPKEITGIPWKVAFALQADGWYLRQDIIWNKPNVMPESTKDRCTRSHEYLFMLTKSPRYRYDYAKILEPVAEVSLKRAKLAWKTDRITAKAGANGIDLAEMGTRFVNPAGRNKRSVWTVPTARFKGAHFAVMPEKLVEPCVMATTVEGETVMDPFMGAGTVGIVALRHGRRFIGVELNAAYVELTRERILDTLGDAYEVEVSDAYR
jgi:GH24 family phage-related lysozyme (muramidase)